MFSAEKIKELTPLELSIYRHKIILQMIRLNSLIF
jgi:hypothetical protein